MGNNNLEAKIRKYNLYIGFIVIVLVMSAYIAGHYFYFDNYLRMVVVGLVLGLIGGATILIVEYSINKQRSYTKGLELEDGIAKKLNKLNIKNRQHIETEYGDLDLLVEKYPERSLDIKELLFEDCS